MGIQGRQPVGGVLDLVALGLELARDGAGQFGFVFD